MNLKSRKKLKDLPKLCVEVGEVRGHPFLRPHLPSALSLIYYLAGDGVSPEH